MGGWQRAKAATFTSLAEGSHGHEGQISLGG